MATILLTGGTGFVGGFLSIELLKRGHFVIFLARGKGKLSAKERVDLTLKFINPSLFQSLAPLYRVVEGDITKGDLGLSQNDITYFNRARPTAIFHSAGSIDFSEAKREITRLINYTGTKNVLHFASVMNVQHFHHLSTLYVAGNRAGDIFEGELLEGQSFNNIYEETKAKAELLVHEWAKNTNSLFSIYRLPVVIGDSHDGKTLSFAGFYNFFRPFWELKKSIEEKINHDPRLREIGIWVDNGFVTAPLFVKCAKNSRIDLVPIDWVVRNIRLLSEREGFLNATFHLSHPFAPSSKEVIEGVLPIMRLEGFKFVFANGPHTEPKHKQNILAAYQRMVDSITKQYFAYNTNRKTFVNSNLVDALGQKYSPPPEINAKLLRTELEFAVAQDFQKPYFA